MGFNLPAPTVRSVLLARVRSVCDVERTMKLAKKEIDGNRRALLIQTPFTGVGRPHPE